MIKRLTPGACAAFITHIVLSNAGFIISSSCLGSCRKMGRPHTRNRHRDRLAPSCHLAVSLLPKWSLARRYLCQHSVSPARVAALWLGCVPWCWLDNPIQAITLCNGWQQSRYRRWAVLGMIVAFPISPMIIMPKTVRGITILTVCWKVHFQFVEWFTYS